jgi:hypothetical protein
LPAKAILPQRIRRLTDRVRQQAGSYRFRVRRRAAVSPASTDFAYAEGHRCCPHRRISRTPKVTGAARIDGFCVRRRSPVLPRLPVGARLPAKAILPQRIRRLAHRVRQQAGSYRFLLTPEVSGISQIAEFCVRERSPVSLGSTDFAYAEEWLCCIDQLWGSIGVRRRAIAQQRRSPVGVSLPAKTILPQCIRRLTDRVRQQAGSYRFAYASAPWGCLLGVRLGGKALNTHNNYISS